VGGKTEELWRKGFVEKMSLEPGVEKREVVMDGDSDDERNDELTCVRSHKSDKSS